MQWKFPKNVTLEQIYATACVGAHPRSLDVLTQFFILLHLLTNLHFCKMWRLLCHLLTRTVTPTPTSLISKALGWPKYFGHLARWLQRLGSVHHLGRVCEMWLAELTASSVVSRSKAALPACPQRALRLLVIPSAPQPCTSRTALSCTRFYCSALQVARELLWIAIIS